jgi:hypothetical protein
VSPPSTGTSPPIGTTTPPTPAPGNLACQLSGKPPAALASNLVNPYRVAVADDIVYFTDVNAFTVSAVGTGGGPVTVLASGQYAAEGISVDAQNVYFTTLYGIFSVPRAGGEVATLAGNLLNPTDIAIDGANAYFVIGQDDPNDDAFGLVDSVPLAGGAVSSLGKSPADIFSVAVDATSVYWTSSGGQNGGMDGQIYKAPKGGGASQLLAENLWLPTALVVDGDDVFFTGGLTAYVARVSIDGGPVTMLTNAGSSGGGIAVDASNVYWTDLDEGTLNCIPRGGGQVTVLVDGLNYPSSIAVDANGIYWADTAWLDGEVGGAGPFNGQIDMLPK